MLVSQGTVGPQFCLALIFLHMDGLVPRWPWARPTSQAPEPLFTPTDEKPWSVPYLRLAAPIVEELASAPTHVLTFSYKSHYS